MPGRGYFIRSKQLSNGIIAPYILWEDAPVDVTASEALAAEAASHRPESKKDEARVFLKAFLANGSRPRSEVLKAALANDIGERCLRRASEELGITSKSTGYQGEWLWALPE